MKIAFITGSRSEWGLLRPLVETLAAWSPDLYVTGSHLATEFGETWRQIDFPITEKVECVLSSNTPLGVSTSMGLAVSMFGAVYARRQPDLLVVLGDRYEIFAAVSTAHVFRIPVAHIHGGELTEGSYDDGFRHCITKMSHLHFTAAEEYRERVIQLGENPETVFSVGALGCDGLRKRKHPKEQPFFFVVAYYGDEEGLRTIENILPGPFVSLKGSHDVSWNQGGRASYSRQEFLNLISKATAIIGNSSAGIIEAPALGVPTINIGDRQKGRLMAHSIIHCDTPGKLPLALEQLHSDFFQKIMESDYYTPYRGGNVAERIADLILRHAGNIEVKKAWYGTAKTA